MSFACTLHKTKAYASLRNTLFNEPNQHGKEVDSSTGMEHHSSYITYIHIWTTHMRVGKGCIPLGLAVAHCSSPLLGGIACFFLLGIREHLPLASAPEGQGMPSIFGWGAERKCAQLWEGAAGW